MVLNKQNPKIENFKVINFKQFFNNANDFEIKNKIICGMVYWQKYGRMVTFILYFLYIF